MTFRLLSPLSFFIPPLVTYLPLQDVEAAVEEGEMERKGSSPPPPAGESPVLKSETFLSQLGKGVMENSTVM
jgi:hypothetical protein